MKKKNIIFNLIVLAIVTGLTLYYLISSDLFKDIGKLKSISASGIIIILLLIVAYVLADSYIISHSMRKINKSAMLTDGIGAYLTGNLGSNITPWKIGHFPFCLYYYNRKKYTFEETLTIVCENHLVYSVCLCFLYTIFMIIALINNFTVTIGDIKLKLYLVSLFGTLSNIVYIIFIILLIKNQKLQSLLLKIQVLFTKKFKKDVNIEDYIRDKEIKMKVYVKCFDDLFHHFSTYLKPIFSYLIFMLTNYGLPYVIYLVVSKESFNINDYFYFFLLLQAMRYVSNIIPIPGGTGVTEYCFITVYELAMGKSLVTTVLLVWRILTYFMFIIVDFIYFLIFNSKNQIETIKELDKKDAN